MRNFRVLIIANALMLSSIAPHASAEKAEAGHWSDRLYAVAGFGRANSHVSESEVQSDFNKKGITNTTINDVEGRRLGFNLGIGYELTDNWALEVAYLDLGQVDIKFTSNQSINNLDEVHPESGDGFTGSAIYKHFLDTDTHVRLRLGFFSWQADYQTSVGAAAAGSDEDAGTNLYWGAGLAHALSREWSVVGEIQRFDFDRDDTTYLTIGGEWRF